jgi:hypothetical protein
MTDVWQVQVATPTKERFGYSTTRWNSSRERVMFSPVLAASGSTTHHCVCGARGSR